MTNSSTTPDPVSSTSASRRGFFAGAAMIAGAAAALGPATGAAAQSGSGDRLGSSFVTAKDGTQLYYKDWGSGQPIMFHHGWPLSADDWDAQLLYFMSKGYRVIAMDRRGHGRSTQTATGNDMDTYAADVATLVDKLDLRNAIHIGHSTGGGEVARYVARHGKGRVAKAVLVSSVPPIMVQSPTNPGGTPLSVFDAFRAQLAANRAVFYWDTTIPFYGFNRPNTPPIDAVRKNWWRQGMMGGAKAHYDCIAAFSQTDFTDDLKAMDIPVLVTQGTDDQIVPYKDASLLSVKLVPNGTLKLYPGYPHGMLTTHAAVLNPDILAFLKG